MKTPSGRRASRRAKLLFPQRQGQHAKVITSFGENRINEACLRNQSPSILQLFFKDQVHRLFLPARLFDFRTSAWLLKARAKAYSS